MDGSCGIAGFIWAGEVKMILDKLADGKIVVALKAAGKTI
jgi:hypothetical protein